MVCAVSKLTRLEKDAGEEPKIVGALTAVAAGDEKTAAIRYAQTDAGKEVNWEKAEVKIAPFGG